MAEKRATLAAQALPKLAENVEDGYDFSFKPKVDKEELRLQNMTAQFKPKLAPAKEESKPESGKMFAKSDFLTANASAAQEKIKKKLMEDLASKMLNFAQNKESLASKEDWVKVEKPKVGID